MLVKILIGVVVVVAAFIAFVATRPAAYHVERKVDVAAPPDAVFAVLNDLRQFAGVYVLFGSPLDKIDPAMKTTIEGPTSGVGQSYAWSDSKDAGKGKLTIEESVAAQTVKTQLEFVEPMASKAALTFAIAPTSTGSTVTWSMDGNHNFVGKAMGLFADMDALLGGDIEKALAQLKSVAEAKRATAATDATAPASTP